MTSLFGVRCLALDARCSLTARLAAPGDESANGAVIAPEAHCGTAGAGRTSAGRGLPKAPPVHLAM
jgi:hypothetical protein